MREIELQEDYKNYCLDKCTILGLSEKYKLSSTRIRYILNRIHYQFWHFLNTDTNKHLFKLIYRTPYQTKNKLTEEHEKLEELVVAFDKFTLYRNAVKSDG